MLILLIILGIITICSIKYKKTSEIEWLELNTKDARKLKLKKIEKSINESR